MPPKRLTPRAAKAREALLDAALRLMAERGIDDVPLQEIVEAAGQRNASAVQYHFGSRSGLTDAVARRHQARTDALRITLLRRVRERDDATLTDLAACLVLPLADAMDCREGRDGTCVVSQVILKYGFASVLSADGEGRESLQAMWAVFESRMTHLPVAVRRQRIAAVVAMQVASWADRARQLDSEQTPTLTHEQYVADSIALSAGALAAPAVDMDTLGWATDD